MQDKNKITHIWNVNTNGWKIMSNSVNLEIVNCVLGFRLCSMHNEMNAIRGVIVNLFPQHNLLLSYFVWIL